MNTIEVLNQFKSMGIQLRTKSGKIKYHIPGPVIRAHPEIDSLLRELRLRKAEAVRLLSQQQKPWIEPEVKPVRAIMFWSERLQDHFWWLIDQSILPEIQKDGVPIYDDAEIDIMLNAQNDNERQKLHSFKRTFGARIRRKDNTKDVHR